MMKTFWNGIQLVFTLKVITCIAIDYLCERLCDMAEQFYNGWANKQDFDAHKIWSK